MPKTPPKPVQPARIRISVPHGCKRRSMSIEALDRITRELAYGTTIEIDGKPLYCLGFKTRPHGSGEILVIEIAPECYEFVEKEPLKSEL